MNGTQLGSFLCACILCTGTMTGVSDNSGGGAGNTWLEGASSLTTSGFANNIYIYYAAKNVGSGNITITINGTGTLRSIAAEFTGQYIGGSPLDVGFGGGNKTATENWTLGPTSATNFPNETAISMAWISTAGVILAYDGTAFRDVSANGTMFGEYAAVNTTGTAYTAAINNSDAGTQNGCVIIVKSTTSVSPAEIALIQHNTIASSGSTITLTSDCQVGDFLVLTARVASLSSVTDNAGSAGGAHNNTWFQAVFKSNTAGNGVGLWYCPSCVATTSTLTITSNGNSMLAAVVAEYSGLNFAVLGSTNSAQYVTTGNTYSAGAVSTTASSVLVVGGFSNESANGMTDTPSGGFSDVANGDGNSFLSAQTGGAGTYTYGGTSSSSTEWAACVAVFSVGNMPQPPQRATGYAATSTQALAFGANNTAGSTLVLFGWSNSSSALASVSDTKSNTWLQVGVQIGDASSAYNCAFIAYNCASGANTVTLSIPGATATYISGLAEITGGYNAIDQLAQSHTSAATATYTSPSITTTVARSIICVNLQSGAQEYPGAVSPLYQWGGALTTGGSGPYATSGSLLETSTGTYSASINGLSGTNDCSAIIFNLYIQTSPFVQSNFTNYGSSVSSETCAYNTNVTSGNLLIVAAQANSSTDTISISNSVGSATWTQIQIETDVLGTAQIVMWYAIAPSTEALTVQVSVSPTNVIMAIMVLEYSGSYFNTIDTSAANYSGSSSTHPTTSGIENNIKNNELFVAFLTANAGNLNLGGPFYQRTRVSSSGTFYNAIGDWESNAAAQTQAGVGYATSTTYSGIIANFYYLAPATGIPGALCMLGCGAT